MKCVNCGKKTDEGRIVCQGCRNSDIYNKFLTVHTCGSFMQMEGKIEGVCRNVLFCAPIKKALEGEPLIEPWLGHVICPHSSENLIYILHGEFSREDLEHNYKEYLE